VTVSGAVFLAKKRNLGKHCIVMRVSVLLQIIAIAVVMLPSMLGYIENVQRDIFFNIEMLVHHTLGLIVIAIWIFINLIFGLIL
jgi:putative membrane protein